MICPKYHDFHSPNDSTSFRCIKCFCFTEFIWVLLRQERERKREKWSEKCIDCHIRFSWITSQAHHEWGIELFDPIAPDTHISFIICPWWKQFRVHCSNIAASLSALLVKSLLCCLPTAIISAVFSLKLLLHSVFFFSLLHMFIQWYTGNIFLLWEKVRESQSFLILHLLLESAEHTESAQWIWMKMFSLSFYFIFYFTLSLNYNLPYIYFPTF